MVDLLRFIASLFIIYYHTGYIRFDDNSTIYHFTGAFIFVELFFIIMGYFTIRHFDNTKYFMLDIDNKFKNSFKYTLQKFQSFIPYVISAILIFYLVQFFSIDFRDTTSLIYFFEKLPSELLLLGSQFDGRLGLVWYISASFIIFPIFCVICQTKNRSALLSISILLCIVYFTNFDNTGYIGISSIIRAFFGLLLGVITYFFSKQIATLKFKKIWRVFLSIIEFLSFIISVALLYPSDRSLITNNKPYYCLILLLFIITLSLLLSMQTIQSKIHSKLFEFLGKISLQLYLYHLIIVEFIYLYANDLPVNIKLLITYIGSFVVAVSAYSIVELAKIKLPPPKKIFLEK